MTWSTNDGKMYYFIFSCSYAIAEQVELILMGEIRPVNFLLSPVIIGKNLILIRLNSKQISTQTCVTESVNHQYRTEAWGACLSPKTSSLKPFIMQIQNGGVNVGQSFYSRRGGEPANQTPPRLSGRKQCLLVLESTSPEYSVIWNILVN